MDTQAPQSSQPPARLGVGGRGVGADQSHTEPASLRKRARRQSAEPDSPSSIDIASITTDRPDWEPAPRLGRHYIAFAASAAAILLIGAGAITGGLFASGAAAAYAIGAALLVATFTRGPLDSTLSALFPTRRFRIKIGGQCAPGYEAVERVFRRHFEAGIEGGAQCCAYVRGVKVVDLWGLREGVLPGDAYDAESVVTLASSSKCMTSVVVAMLCDRGHLRYDQKISEIWPAFGQNGKEGITVAELMRHEAGLPKFDAPVSLSDCNAAGARAHATSAFIARQTPRWPAPPHRREYHSASRGWIAQELVMRADPQRRTIGQFVAEEVMAPLGLEGQFMFGVPPEHDRRVAPLCGTPLTTVWVGLQSLLPARCRFVGVPSALFFGWPLLVAAYYLIQRVLRLCGVKIDALAAMDYLVAADGDPPLVKGDFAAIANDVRVRRVEVPSVNGHGNARAMAAVMDVLAGAGARGGVRLLSPAGVLAAVADPVVGHTFPPGTRFGLTTEFTNAGFNMYRKHPGGGVKVMQDRKGFVGWMGLGGSAMQFHPDLELGFGYCMTEMTQMADGNSRSWWLQEALLQCAADGAGADQR